MPRLLISAVIWLMSGVFLALGAGNAFAERRIALVIGNSNYKNPDLSLLNPKNDAEDMAAALKDLGFEVVLSIDASTRDMDAALRRFSTIAPSANSVLFYYAGHAMQYQGRNYLMPVDGELELESTCARNMVSDEDIRAALDRASGAKIMILDACRNNPLASRFMRSHDGRLARLRLRAPAASRASTRRRACSSPMRPPPTTWRLTATTAATARSPPR